MGASCNLFFKFHFFFSFSVFFTYNGISSGEKKKKHKKTSKTPWITIAGGFFTS